MPNFLKILFHCRCKFSVYVIYYMICNLWQLRVFSSEAFIIHYYVLFVLSSQ